MGKKKTEQFGFVCCRSIEYSILDTPHSIRPHSLLQFVIDWSLNEQSSNVTPFQPPPTQLEELAFDMFTS